MYSYLLLDIAWVLKTGRTKLNGKEVKKNVDDMIIKVCEYTVKSKISDDDRSDILLCSAGSLITASLDISQEPVDVILELNTKLAFLQTKLNIELPKALKTGNYTFLDKEEK